MNACVLIFSSALPFPTELVLKQEQEEYQREGIEWTTIEYFNNQVICDLVEQPHKGVLAVLDEACLNVGKVTDEMIVEAFDGKLRGHAHYSSRQIVPSDKTLKHKEEFRIRHYAGDVKYNITGFLEKNRDTLFQDFKRLLFNSSDKNISSMWPEGAEEITKVCVIYLLSQLAPYVRSSNLLFFV